MNIILSLCLFLTLVFSNFLQTVNAQELTGRPIRIIVPFPPGGIADTLARAVGQGLSANLNQPVVIDNQPGAGGNIGAALAAKSPADGYTLFLGLISTHATNISLYKNLPYDPVKDFQPIGRVAQAPLILVVHPSVPVYSVSEFINYAKANPGKLNYASAGVGSASHLAMSLFAALAGIELTHIPFKGTGQLKTELLAGRIQAYFDAQVSGLVNIQAGQVRALGIGGSKRSSMLPDIPLISQTVPNYEFSTWFGLLAPTGIDVSLLNKFNTALRKFLEDEKTKDLFAKQGLEATPSSPHEFAIFIDVETRRLRKIVLDSGARSD